MIAKVGILYVLCRFWGYVVHKGRVSDMSKNTRSNENSKSSANFLASLFLSSKRCTKKIYALKSHHVAIIRYVCDSIDKTHKKTRKFQTRLYQSQIAKYTFISRETVNRSIKHLIKKRLLRIVDKNTLSIGKILHTCDPQSQTQDVCSTVTRPRSVILSHTSNSSNITNRRQKLSTGSKEVAESNIRSIRELLQKQQDKGQSTLRLKKMQDKVL